MNILLVNPPVGFSYYSIGLQRPPLSLAYLASSLGTGHRVKIVDFNVRGENWKKYPYGEFDLVGLSVDTARYPAALRIARLARERGARVVAGGPHVSFLDEEALASGQIDFVVRNEGERSFRLLVDHLCGEIPFDAVRGVSRLAGDVVERTPDTPFITDLDALPMPARDLLHLERYRERMNGRLMTTMITSRGCPFNCTFCASSEFFGVKWRSRSVDSIMAELEVLYEKYGYRAVCFVDDNFTLDPQRAIEISERIIARKWDLIWEAWSRVDSVVRHPEMIRAMARSGFCWTFIGFESGSQQVLDGYGKKTVIEDAHRAMRILRANKVQATGAFILGALNETPQTIDETIRFAKALNPRKAQFSILTPYPGTVLREQVRGRLLGRNWSKYTALDPVVKLDHLTPGQLSRRLLKAYASFYLRPRKASENLRNITHTLPGLVKFCLDRMLRPCPANPMRPC